MSTSENDTVYFYMTQSFLSYVLIFRKCDTNADPDRIGANDKPYSVITFFKP